MMELLVVKSVALLGIGFVTFGGAYLPYWLKRRDSAAPHTQAIVAISHNLAGGVFVAAALIHLIPDAAVNLRLQFVLGLVTLGVLFADLVESIAVPSSSDYLRSSVFTDLKSVVYVPEQTYPDDSDPFTDSLLAPLYDDDRTDEEPSRPESPSGARAASHFVHHHAVQDEGACASKLDESLTGGLHGRTVHHHHIQVGGAGILSWLVFSLLSFHAMVTGAAFGMTTGMHDTLILALVIISHKGVESFAVAFNFAEGSTTKASTMALFLYGLMTPIGALLAFGAQQLITSEVALLVQDVLEAFAAGNFLYVGMMHLQDKTCCRLGWIWAKAVPELLGAGIMVAVSFWL